MRAPAAVLMTSLAAGACAPAALAQAPAQGSNILEFIAGDDDEAPPL